jgi:hypothetical protein
MRTDDRRTSASCLEGKTDARVVGAVDQASEAEIEGAHPGSAQDRTQGVEADIEEGAANSGPVRPTTAGPAAKAGRSLLPDLARQPAQRPGHADGEAAHRREANAAPVDAFMARRLHSQFPGGRVADQVAKSGTDRGADRQRYAQRRQADRRHDLHGDRSSRDQHILDVAVLRGARRRNGNRPVVADDRAQVVRRECRRAATAADHDRDLIGLADLCGRQRIARFGRKAVGIRNKLPERWIAIAGLSDIDQRVAALNNIGGRTTACCLAHRRVGEIEPGCPARRSEPTLATERSPA